MPRCSYCGESFDDEEVYLDHLGDEHTDELGRIDRRRVEHHTSSDGWNHLTLAIGGVAILAVLVVVGVFLLGSGDGSPATATSGHIHGSMTVTIDGTELPLSESGEFTNNADFFHFHGNEMEHYGAHVWHLHTQNSEVTLQAALQTLGIEVDDSGTTLTYDGETYENGQDGTQVDITVNGEAVEPGDHALRGVRSENEAADGAADDVEVSVRTGT